MEKETRSGLIRATIAYFVIAIIMGILSFGSTLTVGEIGSFLPYIPPDLSAVGVFVIFVPLLVGISFFYVSILIGALFEGTINRVIISGLYAGGFSSFVVVYMIIQPMSEANQVAGYLFMGSYAIYFIYSIISVIAELRDQHYLRVISGSLAIFILGQVCVQMVNLYMVAPGVPETEQVTLIKEMLNIGFSVASGITLVGIFRDSRNVYLSQFGGIASNYFFVTALSLIGTLYLNFIGGRLTDVNPVIKQLSPYIEWTGVVIVGAFIFTVMRRGMTETMMVPTELGDWGKHIQDTSSTKGKQLKDFTEIIKEFVDRGKKERIIVKLFRFLNENRASEPEMGRCLKELIEYEDQKHPNFAKRGVSKKVDENNQERRMLILERTVQHINGLGLGAYRSKGQNQVTEEIKEN
jgi:hypothetical protein